MILGGNRRRQQERLHKALTPLRMFSEAELATIKRAEFEERRRALRLADQARFNVDGLPRYYYRGDAR